MINDWKNSDFELIHQKQIVVDSLLDCRLPSFCAWEMDMEDKWMTTRVKRNYKLNFQYHIFFRIFWWFKKGLKFLVNVYANWF